MNRFPALIRPPRPAIQHLAATLAALAGLGWWLAPVAARAGNTTVGDWSFLNSVDPGSLGWAVDRNHVLTPEGIQLGTPGAQEGMMSGAAPAGMSFANSGVEMIFTGSNAIGNNQGYAYLSMYRDAGNPPRNAYGITATDFTATGGRLTTSVNNGSSGGEIIASTSLVNANFVGKHTMALVRFDDHTLKAYLDGIEIGSRTTTAPALTLGYLGIGANYFGGSTYLPQGTVIGRVRAFTFPSGGFNADDLLVLPAAARADAAISTVVASPTTVANDGVATSTIRVTLKDASRNPVAGKTVIFASSRGATDTLSATSGTSGATGVVTFTVKSSTAGSSIFTANDTTDGVTVTQTATVIFSPTAVTGSTSTVVAAPTSVVANGSTLTTVTVTLKDLSSNPVAGKTVTLASSRGAADTMTAASGPSSASGVVTFTVKSTTAGAAVLTATDTSDSLTLSQTATVTFIAGPVSASGSTVAASPTSVLADGTTASTVTVTLKDANGNPVSGKSVTLASSRSASDTISIASGPSSASGVVTCTVKSATPGTSTYTATDTTDGNLVIAPSTASVNYTANTGKDILTCNFPGLGGALVTGTTVTLTVPIGTPVANLAPTFTLSSMATISPVSGTARDFTNSVATPLTYTVTAQNATTKSYSVTVRSYAGWLHSGSLWILTIPDGANLPAGATEMGFPLLVRLHTGNFAFGEAQPDGRDIRFATAAGAALPYQIEQWDAASGLASIWVKIPTITGNARQEIKMYWGKSDVASESNGAAVFNAANGYASVLHLNESVSDVLGAVTPTDTGTTLVTGMIGKGRNFSAGQGLNCGTNITTFPNGSSPHTSEAWFRPAAGGTLLAWGAEQGQGKVVMQLASPPHVNVDCYWSGGSVTGGSTLPLSQWIHVAHTYQNGEARVYVNGVQDGSTTGGTPLNLPTPARMYLGGWYDNYNYAGDMDEVRISKVTRSANWIKLEYQNQNPQQTLVGSLVPDGTAFSVAPATVTMNEGTTTTLTAQAGGAQKVSWSRVQDGQETVLAVDRLALDFSAGRVTGNQSLVIRFKAVYPTETRTSDVTVTIVDTVPDPVFTLTAPAIWDGRQTITVTPDISNLAALQAAGATTFHYNWSVAGVAVSSLLTPGILTLTRSQGSGPLTVTLVLDNGGVPVSRSKIITIQEPATDTWVQRTPGATEKPVTGQFIAADDTRKGRIYYYGTQAGATSVFLRVYKTESGSDVLYSSHTSSGSAYAFTAPIDAGLFKYKVVLSSSTGGAETVRETVTDLVCGDAYIIDGQSNAVAYDYYGEAAIYPDLGNYTSPWIRSFGTVEGGGGGDWGLANTSGHFIGMWGMAMARSLLLDYSIPLCIINGAVGGTRIDQHQANPADHYAAGSRYSIYANLITRVASAKLTHGIRGALWHQGEADLSNWGGNADWDYVTYQQNFLDMSAAWKQDMPNLRNYYLFQVFAAGCGTSGTYTSDMLREVQRTLPRLYSHMSIMPTLAFPTGANCHFNIPDYEKMGLSMAPLVARDNYGLVPTAALTGPNLQHAWFTTTAHNEITLEFDQNMSWSNLAIGNFFLDRVGGKVISGSATGKIVKLQLNATSTNTTIDYVVDQYWDVSAGHLLYGSNGIAALSFYGVALTLPSPTGLAANPNNNQVALSWSAPSSGATGYKVKRSLSSGGPYTVLATPSATSYTDISGTNGTTYYYVVSATKGTDESLNSAEASATLVVIGTGVTTTTLDRHSGTGSATTYGDALSFDVTVSGAATPTGMVTLRDGGTGGTVIGSGILAAGTCTIAPDLTALTPGNHNNLVAVYSGDSNFASSTSGALGTQAVSPKALTVTGTAVTSKAYDGTLTATLTGATLSGVVGSDTVTLGSQTTGTFNTKDMGAGKAVTAAMTIAGASAANYTLTQPALTGTISAKALTVTGTTVTTKPYDGSTAATLTGGTLNGVVSGDTVTLLASGAFNTKDVGTGKAVTSTSTLAGAPKDNYSLTQPTGLTGTITARVVTLSGSRDYDGTTNMAAASLTIDNRVSGDEVTLAGITTLVGRNAGSQAIVMNYVTPVRARSATGNTGTNATTSFTVNMGAAPANGNTMVAVISTRGTSSGRVTGITQTGATWTRAAQTLGTAGTTTEIWVAPDVSGAAAIVSITQANLRSAAVVMEYGGVLAVSPLDQSANATGNSAAAVTGTTPTTTQADELWIGGIGLVHGGYTLGTPNNSFATVSSSQSTHSLVSINAKVYALERMVTASATANSGGTLSTPSQWSGAIATFRAASTLQLAGAAAGNYTLAGASGSVMIHQLATTVTAVPAIKTYDGTTPAAGLPTITPALAGGDTTTIHSQAFETATAGIGNKVIIPSITINDGNGGANYALTLVNCPTGTINQAPATVTLGDLAVTYDGFPKAASVTTDPAGLAVDLTYDGSPTPPTQAGSYAVVATLSEVNYTGTASGTLVISLAPFDSWAGDPAQGLTAGVNDGPLDDPDHDGMTNQQEFAFGLNPSNGSSVNPITLPLDPVTGRFQYTRRAGSGLTYQVLTSTNLGTWAPDAGATEVALTTSGEVQAVTVHVSTAPAGGKLYVRVQAQ
ncbi:MAG: DUF2341 domain-containing protein [Verrucomicrobia bacterium]|nr:DUF2341 domain-containing protein [Verrucomicrobiota bacterium]